MLLSLGGLGCSKEAPQADGNLPPNFHAVKPVAREASAKVPSAGAPPTAGLTIGRGRYFSYALPPDWRVGEDGQFALTLMAPDNKSLTVMVGNAGMPVNYTPAR